MKFIHTLLAALTGCCAVSALEIQEVKIGTDNRWLDATAAFRKAKVNDDFYCGWFHGASMAGKDPAPGKIKQIIVRYKDNDGSLQTRTLEEKTFAAIAANTPGPTQEFSFGRAFWGDRGKFVEVTDCLRDVIQSKKTIDVWSGALGVTADPLPGKVKYLIVLYSIGGETHVTSFKERERFAGSMIDGSFAPIPLSREVVSPFKGVALDTAVWQWSIRIPGGVSHETDEPAMAFLYIPPKTQKLRGVVVGQFNMLERPIMEHPKFREYLQKLDYGCIWIAPTFFSGKPWNGNLDYRNPKHTEPLDAMFKELARVSGYAELAEIPFVGLGHSAMANLPYQMAAWKPERAIAGISFDGTSPGVEHNRRYGADPTQDENALNRMEGIPFLQRTGGYGPTPDLTPFGNDRPLIARKHHPAMVLTSIADPGSTHFDINDDIIDYMGQYLLKADKARGVGTLPLRKVEVNSGWFIDLWQGEAVPRVAPAPATQFKAAKTGYWGAENNWVFDEEHAKLHEAHEARYRGKKTPELGYIQSGAMLPRRGDHFQVHPAFRPEKDGLSFKLKGGFMESIKYRKAPAEIKLDHPADAENVRLVPSGGPVVVLDPETVALRFDRFGFNKSGRSHSFSLNAVYPGNQAFRRGVMQSSMGVPPRNTQGTKQFITFPPIPDVKAGTPSVKLEAVCNTGMPVEYFVVHGPAYLKDGELFFTEIPPGAKFPVEVEVTAWQYGTGKEPRLQTAAPVTRKFNIIR